METIVDKNRTVKLSVTQFSVDQWSSDVGPGLAAIFSPKEDGCVLHFGCPGCGIFGGIHIGYTTKPASLGWLVENGNRLDPTSWTLTPSIHCRGCCGWHGYLKNGVFIPC